MSKSRPVSHPGVYIKDAIEELGLNQTEFALRSGLSIKNVSTLISGDSSVTFEVANKLAAFFGNSVTLWVNLQIAYDVYVNLDRMEKEEEREWEIVKMFDKSYLNEVLGIEVDSKNKEETILSLKKELNIGYLGALKQPDLYAFCKTSVIKDIDEKTIIMRNAWISLAEKEARKIKCNEFNKNKIIENIDNIRRLTLEDPSIFVPKLKDFLASCGVKMVILPYLPKSNVSGATKWISSENCAMVAVNDYGKDADKIWFSIFHELGHVIKNHKRHVTVSYTKDNILDDDEKEANAFARDNLIKPELYNEFIKEGHFDLSSIREFAKKIGVADFIVIGRLQKDKYISWDKYVSKKIQYTTRITH